MSNNNNNNEDLEVYIYRGIEGDIYRDIEGERVPNTVEKLIVQPGVRSLPDETFCGGRERLRNVSLPGGLLTIGESAFYMCSNLSGTIRIPSTVRVIGEYAFSECGLVDIEFEVSKSSPHPQLQTIKEGAFEDNCFLERIKLPPSVSSIGRSVFGGCNNLKEANLSTTRITEISDSAFSGTCLQTASLPNTVTRIAPEAFWGCPYLVTVIVPLDSKPIRIGAWSFRECKRLANLVLPKDSAATGEDPFLECDLLQARFGEDTSRILAGLIGRFDNLPIHRICYDHAGMSVEDLQQFVVEKHQQEGGAALLLDSFQMTPLHVLFSTVQPKMELLEALLEHHHHCAYQILNWKDANGKRPLDYLMFMWTDGALNLLRPTLQKCMLDPLKNWGSNKSWVEAMETKVGALLFELVFKHLRFSEWADCRVDLMNEVYSTFVNYQNIESTSILELALWKGKLKCGWNNNDGSKRQALDRVESRCVCGSDIVIPNVIGFLYA